MTRLAFSLALAMVVIPMETTAETRAHWSLVDANGPQARTMHCMTAGSDGSIFVLSGVEGETYGTLHDFWRWDGAEWLQLPDVPGEGWCVCNMLAFDPVGDVLTTVEWNPDDRSMVEHVWDGHEWTTAQIEISPRGFHHLVWDQVAREMVLFGGSPIGDAEGPCVGQTESHGTCLRDTWRRRSGTWETIDSTCENAPPCGFDDLFFDTSRGAVRAVQYEPGETTVWELIGDHWLPVDATDTLVAAIGSRDVSCVAEPGGVFDEQGGRWLSYGRFHYPQAGNAAKDLLASFDGEWNEVSSGDQPKAVFQPGIAFSAPRNEFVLFGGAYHGGDAYQEEILGETWILKLDVGNDGRRGCCSSAGAGKADGKLDWPLMLLVLGLLAGRRVKT